MNIRNVTSFPNIHLGLYLEYIVFFGFFLTAINEMRKFYEYLLLECQELEFGRVKINN